MEDSYASDFNDSKAESPGRPISVNSDHSELPSMVYQLPPPLNPTFEINAPMSPTSSTSSNSRNEVDSTSFKPYLNELPVDLQNWNSSWTNQN